MKYFKHYPDLKPFIVFLDIDGVLNCETFYLKRLENYKEAESKDDYIYSQICQERLKWFDNFCKEVNVDVVISSTWRMGRTIEELQEMFNKLGSTFRIIGKTENLDVERGSEISRWIRTYVKPEIFGENYFEFKRYAIIDDDSDMLLTQQKHFFQTDNFSGLTPNILHRINLFFNSLKLPELK